MTKDNIPTFYRRKKIIKLPTKEEKKIQQQAKDEKRKYSHILKKKK